jgi:hypothetical protein
MLGQLIGRGDALMFGEPSMRAAFLRNVRFDLPANCDADEGLPIGSLGLARANQLALRLLPHLPHWLFRALGVRYSLAKNACQLVKSASGLCIVDQPELTPQLDVIAGRSMQSAWLALTAHGIYAQPMMSIVVLDNMHCRNALPVHLKRDKVARLLYDFRKAVPELGIAHPTFLMRYGYAKPPSVRTGRLTFERNTTVQHVSTQASPGRLAAV